MFEFVSVGFCVSNSTAMQICRQINGSSVPNSGNWTLIFAYRTFVVLNCLYERHPWIVMTANVWKDFTESQYISYTYLNEGVAYRLIQNIFDFREPTESVAPTTSTELISLSYSWGLYVEPTTA